MESAAELLAPGRSALRYLRAHPRTSRAIQAFVLGATWPSVVTRIMSAESDRMTRPPGNPADVRPPQVPTPPNAPGATGWSRADSTQRQIAYLSSPFFRGGTLGNRHNIFGNQSN